MSSPSIFGVTYSINNDDGLDDCINVSLPDTTINRYVYSIHIIYTNITELNNLIS